MEERLLPFLLFLISCLGYSTKSLLPSYFKTIYINDVKNLTTKPLIENTMKEEVIRAFTKDGSLQVSSDRNSDMSMEIEIKEYKKSPQEYDASQTVYRWRIKITVHVLCTDQVKNRVFWEGDVSFWEDMGRTEEEEETIEKICKKIAEDIVTKTITNW